MTRTTLLQQVRQAHDDVSAQVDTVERRVARLGAAREPREAAATLASIRQALAALELSFARTVSLEQGHVFPVIRDSLPEAAPVLATQRSEHADVVSMIDALATTLAEAPSDWRDERVRVAARDLVDLLRIHMRKEEAAIHRVLERVLTAEELALASRPPRRPGRGPGARGGGARTPDAPTPRRSPDSRSS